MIHLTILHTNDLHGRVPQLLRIATLVRRIRAEVAAGGGYCIYLDAGDAEDTSLLESSLSKGSAMDGLLRGAGCDYAALGNAIPGRYGVQALAELAAQFGRPLLCANLFDSTGRLLEGLQPLVTETLGDARLGMIGLTDPIKSYETFHKLLTGNPSTILPEQVKQARAQGAQTIVLLSHLGFNADRKVAEDIAGIDVIIGGHSHTKLDQPLSLNGTIIAQAGEFGQYLGRLDLTLDPLTGKIVDYRGELIPVREEIPVDPAAQAALAYQQARVQRLMDRQVGVLADPVKLTVDSECTAGNLLADALLKRVEGAQIALVLAGHWSTGLEAGVLTKGALFAANRSTANPARAELTGKQIETFLRRALRVENAARMLPPLRGVAVGMPHVAGMQVSCDANDLNSIHITVGDQALEPERSYIVASTDMEFSDFIGYLVIPDEEVEYEVPTIMPEVLEAYIAPRSPLGAPGSGRLNVHR